VNVHPTAALFPLITGEDFDELCESIKANGLLESIIKDGDELIDGRNRLAACEKLGVAPRFLEWSALGITDQTKSSWILAKNVTRRHLNEDQRTMIWTLGNKHVAEEIAQRQKEKSQFKPGKSPNPGGRPKSQAHPKSGEPERDSKKEHANSTAGRVANGAGVSRHKAEQAIAVAKANPELAEQVRQGLTTLNAAVKKTRPPRKPKPLKVRVLAALKSLLRKFESEDKSEVHAIILGGLQ